jgi:hypothetical protein
VCGEYRSKFRPSQHFFEIILSVVILTKSPKAAGRREQRTAWRAMACNMDDASNRRRGTIGQTTGDVQDRNRSPGQQFFQ